MTREAHTTGAPAPSPATAVSLTEAARRVGVSRRTLGRAIAAGQLRRQPDGRVALADLLALGYELGPGGRSSVLAVRLLEELTAAHTRERELLVQQYAAALQAQAAAFHQQQAAGQAQAQAAQQAQAALQAQVAALQQQLATVAAPQEPAELPAPAPRSCRSRRVALALVLGLLPLLL